LASVKDANNDWGIAPKNNSAFDFSGTWDGVMGRVILKVHKHILKRP